MNGSCSSGLRYFDLVGSQAEALIRPSHHSLIEIGGGMHESWNMRILIKSCDSAGVGFG